MNATDTNKISTLLNSPAFRAAEAAADAERVQLHQAAVDALLTHEADTAELTAAQDEAEAARRELQHIEAAYFTVRQKHAAASADVIRATTRRDFQSNKLRAEAAKHLPEVMARTEHALRFIESDIRASFNHRTREVPTLGHGNRCEYFDNGEAINAAQDRAGRLRELLERLALEPMASDAIIKLLSVEAVRLIELAKACGALVAHHLPEQIRQGVTAEKPEIEKRAYVFPR